MAEKKTRSKQFSFREVEDLKNMMEAKHSQLQAKFSCGGPSPQTKKKRIEGVWMEITDAINAVGICPRTVAQVKEKWRNMMKKAQTDYTAERISLNKTGGGQALPEMSQTSRDLVDMLKGSASFSGIPGAEVCESIIHNSELKQIEQDASMEFSSSHILWEVDENDNEIDLGEVTFNVPQLGSFMEILQVFHHSTDKILYKKKIIAPRYISSSREETPHRQSTSASKSIPSQSKPKTLEDLQMEYYSQAIALQKVQMECNSKVSKLADVLVDKFS